MNSQNIIIYKNKIIFFTLETLIRNRGGGLENFRQIEIDANKPDFFNNLGYPISEIQETGNEIQQHIDTPTSQLPAPHEQNLAQPMTIKVTEDCTHLIWLGVAAISVGAYMLKKKD